MKIKDFNDVSIVLAEIAKAKTKISKAEAEMNEAINAIKKKYDNQTATSREIVTLLSADVEAFCKMNKAEFEKKRSKEFAHGVIGFRNTPPKVVAHSRKFTIAIILGHLKNLMPQFVRTKEEIDKEAVLAEYTAKTVDDKTLAAVGLRVDNEELFYLDIKEESLQEA